MKTIKQFPHCDPRILHAPGECEVCDSHPDWQELREFWHIAFTGKPYAALQKPFTGKDPILPCPFDLIRGSSNWGGNQPVKQKFTVTITYPCKYCKATDAKLNMWGFCENTFECGTRKAEQMRQEQIITLKSEIAERRTQLRALGVEDA